MPAAFKNVRKTGHIAADIGEWVDDRIAHPRLRSKVHYALGFVCGKCIGDGRTIGQIYPQVGVLRVVQVAGYARLFECGFVIIIVIINTDYGVAALKQA